MLIPTELKNYFEDEDFSNYPFVRIPQKFADERGIIINIADGKLGDVALIESKKYSVRANHYHQEDWHLCFLLEGKYNYTWMDLSEEQTSSKLIQAGQLVFTPKRVVHRLEFLEDSKLIVVSKLSRISENYEVDTFRISDNFEKKQK